MFKLFSKNKTPNTGDLRRTKIVRLQSTDWYLSDDRTVLEQKILVTTNYGIKTWLLSFNKLVRENGDIVLYFKLFTDTPTAGDDIGNFYPAIIEVDGKPLLGITLKLLSQENGTLFMTDDPEEFKNLGSFCLSGLSGSFVIIGKDEKAVASFPWEFDETYKQHFPAFAASYTSSAN